MRNQGLMSPIREPSYHGGVPDRRTAKPPTSSSLIYPHRHVTDKELRP